MLKATERSVSLPFQRHSDSSQCHLLAEPNKEQLEKQIHGLQSSSPNIMKKVQKAGFKVERHQLEAAASSEKSPLVVQSNNTSMVTHPYMILSYFLHSCFMVSVLHLYTYFKKCSYFISMISNPQLEYMLCEGRPGSGVFGLYLLKACLRWRYICFKFYLSQK